MATMLTADACKMPKVTRSNLKGRWSGSEREVAHPEHRTLGEKVVRLLGCCVIGDRGLSETRWRGC